MVVLLADAHRARLWHRRRQGLRHRHAGMGSLLRGRHVFLPAGTDRHHCRNHERRGHVERARRVHRWACHPRKPPCHDDLQVRFIKSLLSVSVLTRIQIIRLRRPCTVNLILFRHEIGSLHEGESS